MTYLTINSKSSSSYEQVYCEKEVQLIIHPTVYDQNNVRVFNQ